MEAVFPRLIPLLTEALNLLLKTEVKITATDKTLLRQRWTYFNQSRHPVAALELSECCMHMLHKYGFAHESGILRCVQHELSKARNDNAYNEVSAIARHHQSATPHMSNDTVFANLLELSQDQIWVREFPRLYGKWMQIAHTAYHDNETGANMFFYFALSTARTEAEYARWFVSMGPNTYHNDIAKIAALQQHFAATPHRNVTHDQMIFVQRLYEKVANLTFYYNGMDVLCAHVKNMMRRSTQNLSHSI